MKSRRRTKKNPKLVAITREPGPTARAVTCSAAGACLPCRSKPHLVVDAKS